MFKSGCSKNKVKTLKRPICTHTHYLLKNKIKKAMTLAEVVITIGIIGVIAAYVIPTISANVTQMQNIVAWKKAYSTIENAQRAIMNDNGGDLAAGFPGVSGNGNDSINSFANGWVPYLKVIKLCAVNKSITGGCYSGTFKALTDDYTVSNYAWCPSLVLSDGTTLFFYAGNCGGATFCADTNIFIDVNGSKPPNRLGKDIFNMHYNPAKQIFSAFLSSSGCSGAGWYCGAYYLTH